MLKSRHPSCVSFITGQRLRSKTACILWIINGHPTRHLRIIFRWAKITKKRSTINCFIWSTRCISKALQNPYVTQNPEFHLGLLKQMIYYCIQTCDLDNMNHYLHEGLTISGQLDNLSEQAIYLRLYGYYYAVTGERKQSIAALLRSINLLEKSSLQPEIYFVNIAAAYNYLGELNLRYGELEAAIEHFNKAISICAEKGYTVNATFYTNLGKALFFQGKEKESRIAFVNAHQVYRHSTAIVGCSTMHAFLAYYAARSGEPEHASHHIRVC